MPAMDSATIKGVVERLRAKGLVISRPDPNDQRLRLVDLTDAGRAAFEAACQQALDARAETVEPLSSDEVATFDALLARLV
jgi:MarR family transcriptional regulator, lower aerobic nicotinate degradation pathway regulator